MDDAVIEKKIQHIMRRLGEQLANHTQAQLPDTAEEYVHECYARLTPSENTAMVLAGHEVVQEFEKKCKERYKELTRGQDSK